MQENFPISPEVLSWARKSAGLSIEDVVRKLNRKRISSSTIESWESGFELPTYAQLEKLAYEVYKRPLAIFFFPKPPAEETPKQSFRTLPEIEIARLSPNIRYLVRKAQTMQINLEELCENKCPAQRQILKDFKLNVDVSADTLAKDIREYLGIGVDKQKSWGGVEDAFKKWRNALEDCGIFVFKNAFKDDNISGFCLYNLDFPIIYINNSMPFSRQSFTLFHELAHLLFGTGGIDTSQDDYLRFLKGDNKKIEVLCNRFSGAFLVPKDDFEKYLTVRNIDENLIVTLANEYHVSREVILRKYLNKRLIDRDFYEQLITEWYKDKKGKSGAGGNYYLNQGVYLGYRYIELAFKQYYTKKISYEKLADYLGVKVSSVSGMESLLLQKAPSE